MLYLRIINNLYSNRVFWVVKKWLQEKPIFSFWKLVFKGHKAIESEKNSLYLLLPTLPTFIKTVIYAGVIVIILESYNHFFPNKITFSDDAVTSLLATIASINGVFLGLYFTAISSIASNLLVKATQDVRSFFLSAPNVKQYVQTITLTEIISLFYIFLTSLEHQLQLVSLIFISLLTIYIVVRFWDVGTHIFNSLEPRKSFRPILQNIVDSIESVTLKSFQYDKPLFQNHQNQLCSGNLELIQNLINFGVKEMGLPDEQLLFALKSIRNLLYYYSYSKSKIPTNSLWYKKKYQFKNWSLADAAEISIALNTGTSLQPKSITDSTWLEESLLDICADIFNELKRRGNTVSRWTGVELFVELASAYGKNLDEMGLRLLFKKLDKHIVKDLPIKIDEDNKNIYKEYLALIDSEARLMTGGLLGLSNSLNSKKVDNLYAIFSKIKWNLGKYVVYDTGLPSIILGSLEDTYTQLKNEEIIEGCRVSEDWYILTLCFQNYLFSLESYFKCIKDLHSEYFQIKLDKFIADEHLGFAAELLQRWIEFSNKYDNLVDNMNTTFQDCEKYRLVKDLPWAKFDFLEEKKISQQRINDVTDKLIVLLPRLQELFVADDLPDYFGQALTFGIHACYQACYDNNPLRLRKILPEIFIASLQAFDITKEKVQDWSQEDRKLVYATEPLINLYEICGYIKIYAELYQNQELWLVAKQLWDGYLEKVPNPKKVIEFIAAISNYRDSLFSLMPHGEIRMNWRMVFERKMVELGLYVYPFERNEGLRASHISPIIRVYAKWSNDARNIFFATYLAGLPASEGIDLPDRHDLKRSIQEESNKHRRSTD